MRPLWLALVAVGTLLGQTDAALRERLQRLEDKDAIQKILLDYGRTLDARDFKAYANLFTKDGEWIGGFGTVKGTAAIEEFMKKNIPGANTTHTYHLLSNFVIDVTGDKASAWSRWAFVTPGADGKPVIAQGGQYTDTLVREGGAWKIQRRLVGNDIPQPPK